MKLHEYQQRCVSALLRSRRGYIVVPAGGGKTVIAGTALSRGVEKRGKPANIGWLCATREQRRQADNMLSSVELRGSKFLVSCDPSRFDATQFDVVVVDECHHAVAGTWSESIGRATGAVWGLTATPKRADGVPLDGVLGPMIERVSLQEVRATGQVTSGETRIVDFGEGMEDATMEAFRRGVYGHLIGWNLGHRISKEVAEIAHSRQSLEEGWELIRKPEFLTQKKVMNIASTVAKLVGIADCGERNELVIETCKNSVEDGHVTLCLVSTIEQGKRIVEGVSGSMLVHSKIGDRKRREAIEAFRAGRLRCMVATSLADEGADFPIASSLVLACGGRSAAKIEQRTGRVMRSHPERGLGIVRDFSDKHHPMIRSQFYARLKVYKRLGYKVEGER